MTIEEVKKDGNMLCGMSFCKYNVDVFLVYIGGEKLQYYFFLKGKLVFSGNDFRPSPMHYIDSIDCMVSLLGFLTLKKGDTDPEYFEGYTPDQWAWSESIENEGLRLFISDFEENDSEYYKDAKKFFKEAYFLPE